MPALSLACANSISITMYLHREQLKITKLLKIEKQKNKKSNDISVALHPPKYNSTLKKKISFLCIFKI